MNMNSYLQYHTKYKKYDIVIAKRSNEIKSMDLKILYPQ
jgi:transglutaminase/protease-like cytokinesis protein 3